jgi:adenosine deaminase CECR1
MFTAEGEESLEHKDWLRIFQEAVEDVRQQLRAENREDAFVGAKVPTSLTSL